MSLENARMSAVLQVASRVFGRRMEVAIKASPNAGCIADQETALGPLTDIVLQYRGERLARNSDNDICLVLEFDVTGNLNGIRLTSVGELVGELWLVIQALSSAERLSFDISFAYHAFTLVSAILVIPPEVQAAIDRETRPNVSPLIDAIKVTIPFQSLFAEAIHIYGNPELTLVGGESSPALAIGLEIYDPAIGRDNTVDRAHFKQNYTENLLQPAFGREPDPYDWGIQIEAGLMELRMQEEFDALDIGEFVSGWKRTDYKKAYWSGNGLDWDYKGWKDYVNAHYWKHPVWLACRGIYDLKVPYWVYDFSDMRWEKRYKHIDVGIYWLAYADLKIENERILLDPYVFELGFRNSLSHVIPEISRDISPIDVGPARFGRDFLVEQLSHTTKHLFVYGSDQHAEVPGSPDIWAPSEVAVDFSLVVKPSGGSRSMHCFGFANEGTLEGESVLSQFEIRNLGESPLWICSITMQDDPDAVFKLRPPANTPLQVEAGASISVDVLMTVPEGDHATHRGSIRVRCNDFDQPSVLIQVHGVKQSKASELPVFCWEIPDVRVLDEEMQRILDLLREYMDRHLEQEDVFPSVPDPDPDPAPCPECGYYMEVAIAGLPLDAFLEVLDAKGNLVERSQVLNDVHFFSVPLTGPEGFRYRLQPNAVRGKAIIKPGIGRITRVGMFRSDKRIFELATERTFVFTRHADGIDVVDIANPRTPRQVSTIELKGCRNISKGNGFLYALTDDAVAVFDISDPYSPNIVHKTPADPDSTFSIEGSTIRVLDAEKARVYHVGLRRRLLKQYSIQEAGTKKANIPGGHFPVIGKGTKQHRDREGFPQGPFVLQDDYLLKIYDNGDAFEILRKDIVPFPLDRKLLKMLK